LSVKVVRPTTIRLPVELNLDWQNKAKRLGVSRTVQLEEWVRKFVEEGNPTEENEDKFLSVMRTFYRRATEAEREQLLQIADPDSLMERQRQAAERSLQEMDYEEHIKIIGQRKEKEAAGAAERSSAS